MKEEAEAARKKKTHRKTQAFWHTFSKLSFQGWGSGFCVFWFERLDLDVFVGFFWPFLCVLFLFVGLWLVLSRKFVFLQNPRVKQKTFPPHFDRITQCHVPQNTGEPVCPVSCFLLMPVTRDCGHCSSWCFCQSEGGSRGLWAFGGLITVDPWWMAFDGGAFGRSIFRGKLETRIYMCI